MTLRVVLFHGTRFLTWALTFQDMCKGFRQDREGEGEGGGEGEGAGRGGAENLPQLKLLRGLRPLNPKP